jgi:tetratricopeptide (TPR) repeat protein
MKSFQPVLQQNPKWVPALVGAARALSNDDPPAAIKLAEQALEVNPNEPLAWLFKGTIHGLLGEADDALQSSERALLLSPLDPMRNYYESLSATAATGAGAYERAIALAESALRGNVRHGSSYRTLAIAQAMLGRQADAKKTVKRLLAVEPGSSIEKFLLRAGGATSINRKFADALQSAGLPLR